MKHSLTSGSIWRGMLFFALPILLGNIFQQLYNTADAFIVGRFLDKNAYAAVSSSGSLIFLLVGFFNGIAVGAGVVIARYYGAKDTEKLQTAVHTTLAFGLTAGIVLTVLGMTLTPQLLRLMKTDADVLPNSIDYFRMYFAGSIAIVMYNLCVGILQAVGDSRHPLYYLILSSLVNIALDLLFVGVFHWGVWSAALATSISQFVSLGLCIFRLCHYDTVYRVRLRKIRFHLPMLKQVIHFGSTLRRAEFHHRLCKRHRAEQHQRLRLERHGGLRHLCQARGLCLPSHHLLHDGADDLRQPEPRCTSV